MPTFVQPDRPDARAAPGGIRALANVRRRKRLRVARSEHEADVTARSELVLDEKLAQRGGDGDSAPAGPAFWLDRTVLGVPRAFDVDDAPGQVHVLPAKREQLAAAEAGVHGRRPQRPVALRQRRE